ncbi:GGDEF domain-containing protein [Pontibacterium sp. N1Y112]|uniref:diguanylate cyclase n=1 Tax=Pontibacterium sinense TaxID=2781979 RepID=A0A8J7KAZ3_9GAMM|nr:GGDEF domain-containing protein [Pontibacterium sinense]MBE9398596.1 GGDEF domain-containing protein [Pontibacterium sinense]
MKFAENTGQAAEYLRQAIPLMVKHNIPPNPLNYALWYTYVSNRVPELNQELDKTLTTYGTCPNLVGEQMFRQHMIKDEVDSAENVQAGLIALVNDLHEHASVTAEETKNYSDTLQDSLEALQADGGPALPLESIIQTLARKTQDISDSTQRFQTRIDDAQSEIESLKAELEKTRQDARVDPLTGLFNRRVFETELGTLLYSGNAGAVTLVMVDVDHFKKFNDTYGHLMGDKVLQYVGKLLRDFCPEPMLAVRYGGEEFAVIMPALTASKSAELANALREKIQAIRIKQKKSGEVISSITASFGVAESRQEDSINTLIERADKALYSAKEGGRNQVQIAP